MSKGEIFTFILCFCVFLALTAFFIFLFVLIYKLNKKVICGGIDDERIIKDYEKRCAKKESKVFKILNLCGSIAIILVMSAFFIFSVSLKASENIVVGNIPNIVVCKSDSMKEKHEENNYLEQNNLNNQFETFDVLLIHKLPKETELKLYDVVVYEYKDTMIIHRIVGIEEPNEEHPTERHFLLKGDANENNDKFPVLYSQMKGIYRGEKIDCVGSFILFTQSPAGYLCVFYIIALVFIIPMVDKKILELERRRLVQLGIIEDDKRIILTLIRRFVVVRLKKKESSLEETENTSEDTSFEEENK